MKTTQDLINWLDQNGYKEGADDIRRMQTDEEYAKYVDYKYVERERLCKVLFHCFRWYPPIMDADYWVNVYKKLENQ